MSEPQSLDELRLAHAASELAAVDPRLAGLVDENGSPPLWGRRGGFPTLVKIVLEQQVSLDSAAAAFAKLEATVAVEPECFLTLDDAELKTIGFSRQKAGYCRGLATQIIEGSLDLDSLASLPDDEAHRVLTAVKGIGPWTADVYLLFALRRPDVWPMGDRALVVSMAENLPLDEVPSYDEAASIAEQWRPWRSVAARVLWHSYLKNRGRSLD
ncbi:MAG: DNA-3-methyladenine glycosylase 2 family protein [bacterium]|nr:DNA-3-methyladenine glycosylase 2 family protein [bacterium]MCP4964907.1 DNA-3-methyladenine glycosylase 2 family protein [bacterium]